MKRKQPELSLQKSVKAFLDLALPAESFWTATANGGKRDAKTGAMLKASGVVSGFPDLLIFYKGRAVLIELKSPKGRMSESQEATFARLISAGAPVFLCQTLEEVARDLSDAGIPLKASIPGAWTARNTKLRAA